MLVRPHSIAAAICVGLLVALLAGCIPVSIQSADETPPPPTQPAPPLPLVPPEDRPMPGPYLESDEEPIDVQTLIRAMPALPAPPTG